MARRKKRILEEPENHERWLVSYSDFITLLFAFFVVMYSISSVNNAKYESLSDALEEAFYANEKKINAKVEPFQMGDVATVIQPIELDHPALVEEDKRQQLSEEILRERRRLTQVSDNIEEVLDSYIDKDLVAVKRHDFWVELEMNSELLFSSGEAELSRKAIPVLKKVAEVIRRLPNVVNVEGHTDDVPIDTVEFPSNWDLSSARATSVVRELINNNISSSRLSSVGYGEFHPIADNKTITGRFKNRRVVLVLMSQAFARYGMNDEERAKLLNIDRQSESSEIDVTLP